MIVVGVPMYNFGIPSQLKTWLAALAVGGRDVPVLVRQGVEGLLGGKRLVIASPQGGFYRAGTPTAVLECQESYLRSFFSFLGLTDIQAVRAEGAKVSAGREDHGLPVALRQAAELRIA